ncbi:IS256 family transposase [Collinsella sp. LCP19S3_C9]|uniref:IS256 family transposase n=1 Tax=Collinsella sp. LCP19S3_C9 TaxID=3438760 RepID=UPI003F93A451
MVDIQSLLRPLAEQVANAIMDEEADHLCGDGANSRNGYRNRTPETCVGTLNLRIPELRTGSFFPEDVLERHRRVDRALVAAVAEMYATGTGTRKVQRIAEKMGIESLGRDRVGAIAATLDAEIADLAEGPPDARAIPCIWLGATYVECRRGGRVASTAAATAIGCDESGWRRVLGVSVAGTESYESWIGFLQAPRDRGATGTELVASDAHGGPVRAIGEVFQGAAWQRCAVHLMRDCMREAGSWQLRLFRAI